MSNVIKYWKNEKKKKKYDGRMNENNRQRMPILRKKSCIFAVRIEKETIQKQRRSKSTVKKKQFNSKEETIQRQKRKINNK